VRDLRTWAVVTLPVAVAVLAAPALASRAPRSALHALVVQIGEWNVIPSQGRVTAGQLRLTVENLGALRHELDIIRTSSWGEKLPTVGGRAVGRDAVTPVVVRPGETRSVHVSLTPGFYILLDNIRGHYALGTEVPLVVS
jgi:hypothetical protein